MDEQIAVLNQQAILNEMSKDTAIQLVTQYEQLPVDKLYEAISNYTISLRQAINYHNLDEIENFTHIVYKGLRVKSELAHALRFFYWGYLAREQEEILSSLHVQLKNQFINKIASTKHFTIIMSYLFDNGCSQQKNISIDLNIDKSNLSRILKEMVNCGLIHRIQGPKCVFFELTEEGVKFYKLQIFGKRYAQTRKEKGSRLEDDVKQLHKEYTRIQQDMFEHYLVEERKYYILDIPDSTEYETQSRRSDLKQCIESKRSFTIPDKGSISWIKSEYYAF